MSTRKLRELPETAATATTRRAWRASTAENVDDDQPPICPRCGVTMVPGALSADEGHAGDWVCLECEELGEDSTF